MILQALCSTYLEEILRGVHQPTDDYRIALYGSAADLDGNTTRYSAREEIQGEGYEAGGRSLTGFKTALDGRTAYVRFDNPAWPLATVQARAALIYNASRGNRAVAVLDFGIDVAATNAAFTVALPPATSNQALIRIRG